jgi:hypothetical protein
MQERGKKKGDLNSHSLSPKKQIYEARDFTPKKDEKKTTATASASASQSKKSDELYGARSNQYEYKYYAPANTVQYLERTPK